MGTDTSPSCVKLCILHMTYPISYICTIISPWIHSDISFPYEQSYFKNWITYISFICAIIFPSCVQLCHLCVYHYTSSCINIPPSCTQLQPLHTIISPFSISKDLFLQNYIMTFKDRLLIWKCMTCRAHKWLCNNN